VSDSTKPCGLPATMRVYHPQENAAGGMLTCSRHGQMLEDAGYTYSLLRPSDPPGRCAFLELRERGR